MERGEREERGERAKHAHRERNTVRKLEMNP